MIALAVLLFSYGKSNAAQLGAAQILGMAHSSELPLSPELKVLIISTLASVASDLFEVIPMKQQLCKPEGTHRC